MKVISFRHDDNSIVVSHALSVPAKSISGGKGQSPTVTYCVILDVC